MLKKDLLRLCLLHLLTSGDKYGYEMLDSIHAVFVDTHVSVIYALLRGLCHDGFTTQYQGDESDGPVRKYYRLTDEGRQLYDKLLEQWRTLQEAVKQFGL